MRKATGLLAVIVGVLTAVSPSRAAESACEYSVQLSVALQANPPAIRLSWPQDKCTAPRSYEVYRKSPEGAWWGRPTFLPGQATTFLDTNVAIGTGYEYQVVKN